MSARVRSMIRFAGAATVVVATAGNLGALRRRFPGSWLCGAYDMFSHDVPDPAGGQLRLRAHLEDGRVVDGERVHPLLPIEHFRVASLIKEILAVGDPRAAEAFFRMVAREWGAPRTPINQVRRFPGRLRGELAALEVARGAVTLFGRDAGKFEQVQVCLRYAKRGSGDADAAT